MDVANLSLWARYKGIDVLGTGDFTHPLWVKELKQNLRQVKNKGLLEDEKKQHFILTAEISSIYSQKGKCHRVHNIVMAPDFLVVDKINKELSKIGNIVSDGRPILGISCIDLAKILFKISPDIMLVPAHIWTPWFSVFGEKSGFNTLEEAYGEYVTKITALETGLSSDPSMNWRVSMLDRFSLISNSDSHSLQKLGRELNVFDCELNYWEIKKALEKKDKKKFLYTVEFFPEEGKYYFAGHKKCKTAFNAQDEKKYKMLCPKCKKILTPGVLSRIDKLADRAAGVIPKNAIPYKNLVPLDELIAQAKGVSKNSKTVLKDYIEYVTTRGTEFFILQEMSEKDLFKNFSEKLAISILNVRQGKVKVIPGYDGEYGMVKAVF